jgi:prophage antirepressor-like protein
VFSLTSFHRSLLGQNVRVVTIKGEPWFVAVDVARAIGLYLKGSSVNTSAMVRTLDNKEQEYVTPKDIGGFADNRVSVYLPSPNPACTKSSCGPAPTRTPPSRSSKIG